MPPDAPQASVDELRSIYEVMFGENTLQFTSQAAEVVVAGDLAVMRASYEETITPKGEGEPVSLSGTWLIVLRKQSDGSWKAWHNMWTAVPPPPPPAM
jgi:ketosteroid isomerase-like protein